jgi:hypothetical protein
MNSNEGIEQLVRGYMAMYLPGRSLDEKIAKYKEMASNHRFFLLDNLNHKCYYVDQDYYATEMKARPAHEKAEELMTENKDKDPTSTLPSKHPFDSDDSEEEK